jgi:TIR domain
MTLHVGDSLSGSIDRGLLLSDYGIVIVSKKYFEKSWTKQELQTLITKQVNLNKRIILPVWYNISKEEVQQNSLILVDTVAATSCESIEDIASKLYREIRGARTADSFSSDAKLKNNISSLVNRIEENELQLRTTQEELTLSILTKIYLITEGYSNFYISSWPFVESLSSNENESEKLRTIVNILMERSLVASKALGTISISHQGIKKIEQLLEDAYRKESILHSTSQLIQSVGEVERLKMLEIQELRYSILKEAYNLYSQKIKNVNLYEIGEPLGIEREKLQRIYFYLEDEGLIDSIALGGTFSITNKGRELIEKGNTNRIF